MNSKTAGCLDFESWKKGKEMVGVRVRKGFRDRERKTRGRGSLIYLIGDVWEAKAVVIAGQCLSFGYFVLWVLRKNEFAY